MRKTTMPIFRHGPAISMVLAGCLLLGPIAQAEGFVFVTPAPEGVEEAAQPSLPEETAESILQLDENAYIIFSDKQSDGAAQPDVAPSIADALPLLVNGDNLLPEDYKPDDLVMMAEYCDASVVRIKGSQIEGQRVAVDALMVMLQAAIAEGISSWQISSGYRSIGYQQQMWDNKVYEYRKEGKSGSSARAATARYMAYPGASEHHTGLAFDVTVPGQDSFASTKQSKWLAENCWDYGFIIRYTDEKKEITGINAEPWHIRYVGQPHALIMKESGQCLEEYIADYQ